MRRILATVAALAATLAPGGCRTLYYDTMETLGVHKREILVDRVEEARDEQAEAKEQFRSALEAFTAVVEFDGGDLESTYDRLRRELDRSETRAAAVHDRIESVESVAGALFREWTEELDQYESADLRRRSERQLEETRDRADQLVGAMRRAEDRMEPVLSAFRDQVLFLKHNLNAQAVASLQGEAVALETDVAELIAEMEAAIAEADAFIASMGSTE